MGTSISQASKRNTNWRPVHIGYKSQTIPENRIVNEIWRASENESIPLSSQLKSDIIYSCFEAVKSSNNIQEAVQKFNSIVVQNKANSIIAEFAKRAIPQSFQSENPAYQWTNNFFSEVTNYIMSRDTSGFVGEQYRNKTVRDLIDFKRNISNRVTEIMSSEKRNINNKGQWNDFIDNSVNKLKSNK